MLFKNRGWRGGEEQAALKLSAVEALLKQPIEQKRGAVKDHISTMTAKMIARREKSTQISEDAPQNRVRISPIARPMTLGDTVLRVTREI